MGWMSLCFFLCARESKNSWQGKALQMNSNFYNYRIMKKKFIELTVKIIVAALTAFLTALSTTSCMSAV